MWFCFNTGFISAVQNRHDSTGLVVRARRIGILQELFPDKNIIEGGSADYQYRVFIGKDEFAEIVKDKILNTIDYSNFKSSVDDEDLHEMYNRFWTIHYGYQK